MVEPIGVGLATVEAVFKAILRGPEYGFSQQELSDITGVPRARVSKALTALCDTRRPSQGADGHVDHLPFVRKLEAGERGGLRSRVGRYGLEPTSVAAVGLAVGSFEEGRVRIKGRVIGLDGRPVEGCTGVDVPLTSACSAGLEELIDAVSSAAESLLTCARESGLQIGVVPVGVTVGGHIDAVHGRVLLSPNLGWMEERHPVPLQDRLRDRIGQPVVLENDVNAAALYEQWWGVAARHGIDGSFAAVHVGEGVGSAFVLDGRLRRGETGMAGEIGHCGISLASQVARQARVEAGRCRCGQYGCLETVASSYGISELYGTLRDTEPISLTEIAERVDAGDDDAAEVLAWAGDALGRQLAALVNTVDVTHVVVDGPVVQAHHVFCRAAKDGFDQQVFPTVPGCEVVYPDASPLMTGGRSGEISPTLFFQTAPVEHAAAARAASIAVLQSVGIELSDADHKTYFD